MGMRCLKFFIYTSFFFSSVSFGGDLVYRDGVGVTGSSCNLITVTGIRRVLGTCSYRGGCTQDRDVSDNSAITKKLSCNGATVSVWRSYVPDGCYAARGCVPTPTVSYENDTANYDFNYNMPGENVTLGSISKKSSSNAFLSRPLSKNYLTYSSDGILDKPIILAEGYDPDNNTFPNFYFYRGFDRLVYGGRDLIIVNFPNGSGNMNENAALLQNIIQEINGAKLGNYPIAVIGYSMGGIIARKALKNMELSGLNHQASLYVSYDSPHLGANAPVPLENTVNSIVSKLDSNTAGYTTSALKRAQNVYKSPAAREMLIAGGDYRAATISDFPNNLTRLAVTSGSLIGVNGMQPNSVYEGEYIAGFRFYLYKNWWGQLSISDQWYSAKRGGVYYDNAPGSYDQAFYKAFFELKSGADSFETWNEVKNQNITFVPTISSLAISVAPMTYLKDIFKYKSPFDKYIAADDSADLCTTFRSQTAAGKNITHNPGNNNFDNSQIAQLKCALDDYHQIGSAIPDRSFKKY